MKHLRLERKDGITILRLDKPRGNAIDEPLLEELQQAADALAADAGVRGVLLASGHPKLFCPGLDLVTLLGYDRAGMQRFMAKFARMLWSLYGLRKPVVAAISGHAVAGGCVLALTAGHRILKRGAQIGLNEVRVGLPLPWSVALLLRASVAPGALERVALLGSNFADEEALAVGLAHGLAEAEGFEATCLARLAEFAGRDTASVGATKAYLRADVLRAMQQGEDGFVADFLDRWFSPATRELIGSTVASLQSKG